MRAALRALACGGVLLAAGASAEGDPEAGRLAARVCRTCHGADGIAKIPVAPNIGGEDASYIAAQLRAFREGRRVNEMMSVVSKGLDDATIANLAAFYSGLRVAVTPPPGRKPEAAPQLCVTCHGEDGIALNPDAPNLAGESPIYIDTQIKAFRTGKRAHEVMGPIAMSLSDDDLRVAAAWYSAITVAPAP